MLGGHVIICDDIREEVGGKHTYVGIYKNVMILEGPTPAVLPKLGMAVIWSQTLDEEVLPVELQVLAPMTEAPIFSDRLELDRNVKIIPGDLPPEERLLTLESHIMFSPMEIEGPGRLRVFATRAGRRMSIRKLEISSKPSEAAGDAAAAMRVETPS